MAEWEHRGCWRHHLHHDLLNFWQLHLRLKKWWMGVDLWLSRWVTNFCLPLILFPSIIQNLFGKISIISLSYLHSIKRTRQKPCRDQYDQSRDGLRGMAAIACCLLNQGTWPTVHPKPTVWLCNSFFGSFASFSCQQNWSKLIVTAFSPMSGSAFVIVRHYSQA